MNSSASENHIYCTYCSACKDPCQEPLPAYLRYVSERIARVRALALRDGVPLYILSGEYGLIEAHTPIPWYDHYLTMEESEGMAEVVARQIREYDIGVICYHLPAEKAAAEPDAYSVTLQLACEAVGIALRVCTLEEMSMYRRNDWQQITWLARIAKGLMIRDRAAGKAEFDRLFASCGHDGMIHYCRGQAFEELKEFASALDDYEEAARRFPLFRYQQQASSAAERVRALLRRNMPPELPMH